MSDVLTKEQRHRNMSNIRSKDTKIECILRKDLWSHGIRYRKNYSALPGKPDIVIKKYMIAIFCDSEFFHGKDWDSLKPRLLKGNNGDFWVNKISKNISRDEKVNKQLKALGWTVLRFLGADIKKNTGDCLKTIEEAVFEAEIGKEDW